MSDTTGFLANPNYIDVGDVVNADYYTNPIDPADIDFGGLLRIVSYKQLLELSTDIGDTLDRPNQDVILGAVQAAEAHIDSKAAIHYTVPLGLNGIVPPSVYSMAIKLFRFFLYSRRPGIPDGIVIEFEQADRWLNDVATRRAVIPEFEVTDGEVTGTDDTITNIVGTIDRSLGVFSDGGI